MTSLELFASSIRILSMDAVQKAKSGHPGAPMGMADMAAVLWQNHLCVNPADPQWQNRDRFILSNGHASMLQYAALHLTGFELSLDELKHFRQLHSKTPGHPEYRETPGIEATTGPLGQGIGMAVGFALAERHLAARYNKEGLPLVNHFTYVFLGDGCLMEGISGEASSLAGTLGLGKLICLYDSNGISIDGEVNPWFSEDVAARYEAYGWQVIRDIDGHDTKAIDKAILAAKAETNKPSLIICKTKIGFGAPNLEGTEKSHGAPLGAQEIALTKKALGLPAGDFELPEGAYQACSLKEKGAKLQAQWQALWQQYQEKYPEEAKEYQRVIAAELPEHLDRVVDEALAKLNEKSSAVATRKASENAINTLLPLLPELIGGSADLTGSNLTWSKETSQSILPGSFAGNYIHYGVREFAMSAIMNGMALHGGLRAYGGTFLVFSDYMRNGIRLSALMKLPVIYVLTHDSIGLGEDGPTHQPIEHVSSLRLIPNLNVWRPCDQQETLMAWRLSLNNATPSALTLSRQNLPEQQRDEQTRRNIAKGGYILEAAENPDIVLVATGSEVALIVQAAQVLRQEGKKVQVVSMPCMDIFLREDEHYRRQVLPPDTATVAVEAGVTLPWLGLVGNKGKVIGIDDFAVSAPAAELFSLYGFTVENIVRQAKTLL